MGRSMIPGRTRYYHKDNLIGVQFGLRLPVIYLILPISYNVVSTLIKNTILIGYFAKITPIIVILACIFSRVIFVTNSATS